MPKLLTYSGELPNGSRLPILVKYIRDSAMAETLEYPAEVAEIEISYVHVICMSKTFEITDALSQETLDQIMQDIELHHQALREEYFYAL